MRTSRLAFALLAASATLLAGCDLGSTTPTTTTASPTTGSTTSTTAKTVVIHDMCQLGVPVTFAPGLELLVSSPNVSTGPLGSGNGYSPRYGYYVTFEVTATDVGQQTVDIDPGGDYSTSHTGFVVNETGDQGVTVNSGNTPFDGSYTSLDDTFLNPGNKPDKGPVTFDVPDTHGKLTYIANDKLVCSWTF
ncbi:MAG: hypothetical protein ACRDX8_06500 [Acidimicrobiales bacterium]